jgi:hypothetical protein
VSGQSKTDSQIMRTHKMSFHCQGFADDREGEVLISLHVRGVSLRVRETSLGAYKKRSEAKRSERKMTI